jgi:hypothetical protein
MNVDLKAAAKKRKIPSKNRNGDCYEAAAKYLMDETLYGHKNLHLKLVHGEVTGQGPIEGVKYGHAWVLDGDTVIDKSNGRDVRMPKAFYYALGQIERTIEYTYEEARDKLLEHQTYGPWDLKTEL